MALALYLPEEDSGADLEGGLARGQEIDCIDRKQYACLEEEATAEVDNDGFI